MNAKDLKDSLDPKKLKESFDRAYEDVKSDLSRSKTFRDMKPWVGVVLALLVVVWFASGGASLVFGAATAIAALAIVAGLVVAPPLWVYYDAGKRQVNHPMGWAVFSLLTTPIGWLIYYLIRPETRPTHACQNCEQTIDATFSACPYCGTSQEPVQRTCPACQSEVQHEWRFCPYCRRLLGESPAGGGEGPTP